MTRCACRNIPVCVVLLLIGCEREQVADFPSIAKTPALLADASWPNVVLISIDSLRPDHLGCYRYPKKTSPHIDQLANEGALFENVISSTSWTLPAHAAMFTGLADSVHGCADSDRRLHDDHYTLAERLKDTAFTTVGFFSGPYLRPLFGLSQGFDTYVDCTTYSRKIDSSGAPGESVDAAALRDAMDRDVTSPQVLEEVRAWLEKNTPRPFFMFVHLFDVHFDYVPPPPYDSRFDPDYAGQTSGQRFLLNPNVNKSMPRRDLQHVQALYDGEIAWTDEHVGKLLDELRARELLDTSIIIVTADHGTAFFEHGLKAHRNSLFDEVIRIPLIIRYPARIAAGQRYKQQARMIDLLPTVLDLLGMPPPSPKLMGQSLAPLLAGGTLERDDPAISELFSAGYKLRSFRRLGHKTIWHSAVDKGAIYDLRVDPGELAPLTDKRAPIVQEAKQDIHWSRGLLKLFRERYPPAPKIPALPDQRLEELRRLGYASAEAREAPGPAPAP